MLHISLKMGEENVWIIVKPLNLVNSILDDFYLKLKNIIWLLTFRKCSCSQSYSDATQHSEIRKWIWQCCIDFGWRFSYQHWNRKLLFNLLNPNVDVHTNFPISRCCKNLKISLKQFANFFLGIVMWI